MPRAGPDLDPARGSNATAVQGKHCGRGKGSPEAAGVGVPRGQRKAVYPRARGDGVIPMPVAHYRRSVDDKRGLSMISEDYRGYSKMINDKL